MVTPGSGGQEGVRISVWKAGELAAELLRALVEMARISYIVMEYLASSRSARMSATCQNWPVGAA